MNIGDWVLTPAHKRLQVKAVFTTGNITRCLLSDGSVYDVRVLKLAN
jgi:hypothetical protein